MNFLLYSSGRTITAKEVSIKVNLVVGVGAEGKVNGIMLGLNMRIDSREENLFGNDDGLPIFYDDLDLFVKSKS